MKTVKISKDYQVTIPKEVRDEFKIKVGQKVNLVIIGGIIRMDLIHQTRKR